MNNPKELKKLAKDQQDQICTAAFMAIKPCTKQKFSKYLEKYVQARISLALKFGEVTI